MSYILIGDTAHKNPPQNGCNASASNGRVSAEIPTGFEKCDRCFRLPR
ncbi:hypothetical protein KKG83_02540 [Candidatus Micrarchaeota archaeon]|nr:hypothetical protein [Candidatus Micrarchaeota archaeon]MBU2476327.1 hypothetical protein [Candidatus Micrarchaeota archaeon]